MSRECIHCGNDNPRQLYRLDDYVMPTAERYACVGDCCAERDHA